MIGCLSDLFSLSLRVESHSKVKSLVSTAVKKYFDVVLPSASVSAIIGQSICTDSSNGSVVAGGSGKAGRVLEVTGDSTDLLSGTPLDLVSDSDGSVVSGVSVRACVEDGWVSVSSKAKRRHISGIVSEDTPSSSPIIGAAVGDRESAGKSSGRGSSQKKGPGGTRGGGLAPSRGETQSRGAGKVITRSSASK